MKNLVARADFRRRCQPVRHVIPRLPPDRTAFNLFFHPRFPGHKGISLQEMCFPRIPLPVEKNRLSKKPIRDNRFYLLDAFPSLQVGN